MYPTTVQHDDQDLARRIIGFLHIRQMPHVKQLEVNVTAGRLVIRGHVASEHDKRLCLELCQHVAGVVRVADELRVNDTPLVPAAVGKDRNHRSSGRPLCLSTT